MIGNRVHRAIVPFGGNRSSQRRILTESKLSDLDPRDLGFPWNSIVCVRHLKWGTQGWPDLRSIAHRPALAPATPDSAEVVWFLDAVEWLACLGRAAADSSLDRWWWRTLRPALANPDPVLDAFLRHLHEGRLAWNRLEAAGHARTLEARLGATSIARLERAWTESGFPKRVTGNRIDLLSLPSSRPAGKSYDSFRHNRFETGKSRHELVADRAAFAQRGEANKSTHPEPEAIVRTSRMEDATAIEVPLPTSAPNPDSANTHVPESLPQQDPLHPGDSVDGQAAPRPSDSTSVPHAPSIRSAADDRVPELLEAEAPIEPSRIDAARRDEPAPPLASEPARVFESEFAGLFFVLGALQSLGWIPDFTRPLDRGIGTHPLEYLARLGAHRFGKRFLADPLQTWMSRHFPSERIGQPPPRLPELESRIALALDMRARKAILFLCHRRAKVLVSESRVDVFHRLEHHPLEIRMAGLDRDPGWIPGTSFDFRFHFESGQG